MVAWAQQLQPVELAGDKSEFAASSSAAWLDVICLANQPSVEQSRASRYRATQCRGSHTVISDKYNISSRQLA